jgi:hypothetical protein
MSEDTRTKTRTKRISKRDTQPERVKAAKDAAVRLRDYLALSGITLTRSQALEALARAAGATDWNTFRASLAAPPTENASIAKILHLRPGGELACAAVLLSHMADPGEGNNMWRNRAKLMVRSVVALFFALHERSATLASPDELKEAFHLTGPRGFLALFEACNTAVPDAAGTMLARNFLGTVPGFSIEYWRAGKALSQLTQDQWGYLEMQISKPLGEMIDLA